MDLKLSDAINMFFESMSNKSPLTHTTYNTYLSDFKGKFAGDIPVKDIKHTDIEQFINDKKTYVVEIGKGKKKKQIEKPMSANSINTIRSSLRSFFKYLHKHHYLDNDPAANLEFNKVVRKPPVWLTQEETEQLLEATKVNKDAIVFLTIYMLLAKAGLRIGELVNLKDEDVFGRKVLTVTGKGNKSREIPLNQEVRKVLELYSEWKYSLPSPPNDLFFSLRGKKYFPISTDRIQRHIKIMAKDAGIKGKKVTPHKLRHTFGIHLLLAGVNIRAIQELLGHASVNTTQIYTHVTKKELIDAVEKI